jgi:hemolysin-activating ACP:hemolysin acyltransferase
VAPFGGTDEILRDLKAKVFKDREFRFRAVEAGKGTVRVM